MLTCRELDDFLADWLDGALSLRVRAAFRLHLLLCRDCRRYLRSYTSSIALGRAAFERPDDAPPGEIPEELVRAVLGARRPEA